MHCRKTLLPPIDATVGAFARDADTGRLAFLAMKTMPCQSKGKAFLVSAAPVSRALLAAAGSSLPQRCLFASTLFSMFFAGVCNTRDHMGFHKTRFVAEARIRQSCRFA